MSERGARGHARVPRSPRMRAGLLISALRWRASSSVALFVVSVVAVGAAAFGPMYLRGTDQATLDATLQGVDPASLGMTLLAAPVRPSAPASRFEAPLRRTLEELPGRAEGAQWFGTPIVTGTTGVTVSGGAYGTSLVARTGVCRHVRVVSGRCPKAPGEVLVSTRSARLAHLVVGERMSVEATRTAASQAPPAHGLLVVGLYRAGNPATGFWWGENYFGYGDGTPAQPRLDDVFTPLPTLLEVAPAPRISMMAQAPFVASALTVPAARNLSRSLPAFERAALENGVHASTALASALSAAAAAEHTAGTIVAVVDLQLALVALVVLFVVAGRTADERRDDVALAALRGYGPWSALGVGMAEPITLVVAAIPVGLGCAWGVAVALAPVTYGTAVGTRVSLLAVAAALAAGAMGILATALGAREALARGGEPQAPGARRSRRTWVVRVAAEAVVVVVAALSFYELVVARSTSATGSASAAAGVAGASAGSSLGALAPGLVALALGVLGARALPAVLRSTHGWAASTRRVAVALATRTVARRREFAPLVVLVALCVGLATFAVCGWVVEVRSRQTTSAFETGAGKVLTVSVPSGRTFLSVVRRADPGGRAAMAAVVARSPSGTTLALDASRLAAVASWPETMGRKAASVARALVPKHVPPPVKIQGSSVGVTLTVTSVDAKPAPVVSMNLFDPSDQVPSEVVLGHLRSGTHVYRASLAGGCGGGCRLVNLAVTWTPLHSGAVFTTGSASFVVRSMETLERGVWHPVPARLTTPRAQRPGEPRAWRGADGASTSPSPGGLLVRTKLSGLGSPALVNPGDVPVALPVAVTPLTSSEASGEGGPNVVGLDGGEVSGHTVASLPSLPGVGRNAVLVDLGLAERFVSGSYAQATLQVWLAPGAPKSVLTALRSEGVTVLSVASSAAREAQLSKSGVALAYLLFVIAGLAACALALGAVGFALAASARRRREELLSLRAVGFGTRALVRLVRTEQALVLGTGVVVGAASGALAASRALRTVPVLARGSGGLPLDLSLPWPAFGAAVGAVAVLLAVTAGLGATAVVRGAGLEQAGAGPKRRSRGVEAAPGDGAAGSLVSAGQVAAGERRAGARGGVAVWLGGVVHLYRQSGADVVGLRSVDLDVAAGEMVALLGPSGMGKTTVLKLMAGVMPASAGVVRVGERDLGKLRASERRQLRAAEIGYVVQGTAGNVLPYASALGNVWFSQHAAVAQGVEVPWTPAELLELLGLASVAHRPLSALSRGIQQQVAVASGVASAPRLLLADEPTAELTARGVADVVALLHTVNRELGSTVVIVTHDRGVAAQFPRTVTIRDGRVGSEAHHGVEYAVIDGSGSVQLPPDALDVLPPYTRVEVLRTERGIELVDPRA